MKKAALDIEALAQVVADAGATGDLASAVAARGLTLDEWARRRADLDDALESEEARRRFVVAYEAGRSRQVPTFLRAAPTTTSGAPQDPTDATDETGMMPPPDEVRRLIQQADPRRAIPLGPRGGAPPTSPTDVDETGETLMLAQPDGIRALIERSKGADATLELSVDAYAVVRATIAVRPEDVARAWERFGVPPGQTRDVERAMRRRFDADRAARERFSERLQHFVRHLSARSEAP